MEADCDYVVGFCCSSGIVLDFIFLPYLVVDMDIP